MTQPDFRRIPRDRLGPLTNRIGEDAVYHLRVAAKRLYAEGRSFWGIAAMLGVSTTTVQRWAEKDRWPIRERTPQNGANLKQEEQASRRMLALLGKVEAAEDRKVLTLSRRCGNCLGISKGECCQHCGMPL